MSITPGGMMTSSARPVNENYHFGSIVQLDATGEYARPRLKHGEGSEHPGKVEIGMVDGTVRYVDVSDYHAAWPIPEEALSIPVYPAPADSARAAETLLWAQHEDEWEATGNGYRWTVEPHGNGQGGDAYALFREPVDGSGVRSMVASGRPTPQDAQRAARQHGA